MQCAPLFNWCCPRMTVFPPYHAHGFCMGLFECVQHNSMTHSPHGWLATRQQCGVFDLQARALQDASWLRRPTYQGATSQMHGRLRFWGRKGWLI